VNERRLGIVGKVLDPVVEHLDLVTIRIADYVHQATRYVSVMRGDALVPIMIMTARHGQTYS
jgi:hypothetical protein